MWYLFCNWWWCVGFGKVGEEAVSVKTFVCMSRAGLVGELRFRYCKVERHMAAFPSDHDNRLQQQVRHRWLWLGK